MTKKILILPGDGIGQEVTASAVEVLDFIVEKFNLQFSINSMEVGGTAYDEFGSPIPSNVLNAAKEVALDRFIGGNIKFLQIANLVRKVLDHPDIGFASDKSDYSIDDVIFVDQKTREVTQVL